MSGNKTLVPRLRFPEFREAGPWEEKRLGDVCDILNNRRQPITGSDRVKGDYPYYGASGIVDYVNDYIFDERLLLVGEDGAKWGAFEKTAFLVDGKYWVNNHAHVLKPTGVQDTLLENYLTMLDIGPFITGAAPPKLTLGMLRNIPIPIPATDNEQQKIADCLASLDDLIGARGQRLAALERHKKGLMQQLFPATSQTTPTLRFPEFREAGPWEEKRLGDVARFHSGGTPSKTNADYWDGTIPWISAATMHDIKIGDSDKKITEKAVKDGARIAKTGTLLLLVRGSMLHKRIPIGIATNDVAFNQDVKALLLKSYITEQFLLHLLIAAESILLDAVTKTGIGAGKLDSADLNDLIISVPKPPEQQRIAACLTSVDDLIRAEAQKIAALERHKKGLMQQLFPNSDEGAA